MIDTTILPNIEGIDWGHAMELTGGKEGIALTTARNFYNGIEKEIKDVKELYDSVNTTEGRDVYRIKVHGMKSVTASFGALTLSSYAKACEFAARDNELDELAKCHQTLLAELEDVKGRWAGLKEVEEQKVPCPDIPAAREKIQSLADAMEDMDIEMADAFIESLIKYSYGPEIDELMKVLQYDVTNLDDHDAIERCEQILEVLYDVK